MTGVITADWHLRATPPSCSAETSDEWMSIQKSALGEVLKLCVEKHCDLYVVGDVFNSKNDTSNRCVTLVQELAEELAKNQLRFFVLAGNHDLPYHSSSYLSKSSIGILFNSKHVFNLASKDAEKNLAVDFSACSFDEEPRDAEIVFQHVLCVPSVKEVFPGSNTLTAPMLLERYIKAKWVFVGDYHHSFVYEDENRRVVNPGCLMRQTSDMISYVPSVYYVDTQASVVEKHEIFVQQSFVSAKQLDIKQDFSEFIDSLPVQNTAVDFVDNLREVCKTTEACARNKIADWILQCKF